MTTIIDSAGFAPGLRAEAIREVVWQRLVRVHITHQPEPEQIQAACLLDVVGPLTLCRVRSNATTIRRTGRLAADDGAPALFLGVQGSGSSVVLQGGRDAVLGAGDMALYDTSRPYTLLNDGGIDHLYLRIPRDALALPEHVLAAATGVRLAADSPLVRILARHLDAVAVEAGRATPREASLLAAPTLDLVRAALTSPLGDVPAAREALQDALVQRVTDYVEEHLADPDLTPARIAAAHHVSLRHLYAVLARADIRLSAWVREARLERCRAELAVRAGAVTVAAVAHRWGFGDARNFSRAFRDAYGMSPREWSELARARHCLGDMP